MKILLPLSVNVFSTVLLYKIVCFSTVLIYKIVMYSLNLDKYVYNLCHTKKMIVYNIFMVLSLFLVLSCGFFYCSELDNLQQLLFLDARRYFGDVTELVMLNILSPVFLREIFSRLSKSQIQ